MNDNLGLLAAYLCFQRGLLPTLFHALGPEPEQANGNGTGSSEAQGAGGAVASAAVQPTMAQVALLEVLGAEAHEMPQQQAG